MTVEVDKNQLLQEVLSELTSGGKSHITWQQIEQGLASKLEEATGSGDGAKEYVQEVHDREVDN